MRENKRYDAENTFECPYNEGCACTEKRCVTCGWNPAVEKLRKGELMEQRSRKKAIYASDILNTLRVIKPQVYAEDNGYDRGALDMWKLLYAAVTSAPAVEEVLNG